MNMKISLTLAVLTAFAAPAAMASSIVVDDFTTAGSVFSNLQGNPATDTVIGAGILGGQRYMWASTDGAGAGGTTLEVIAGSGEVLFSNQTNATGQAVLVYDGGGLVKSNQAFTFNSVPAVTADFPNPTTAIIALDTSGLGGVNLLLTGSTATSALDFDVNSFDAADLGGLPTSLDFRAYAWDTAGNVATYFENLSNPFPFSIVTFDTKLRLNEFTFGAAFDWTSIGALAFSVESLTPEFDGALGSISVVPLPASAFLLLGSLGGLFGMSSAAKRRRRRNA